LLTSYVLEAGAGRPAGDRADGDGPARCISREDVMPGIPEMIESVQVEATLPGRHQAGHAAPADPVIPGEVITPEGTVTSNIDLPTVTVEVVNHR